LGTSEVIKSLNLAHSDGNEVVDNFLCATTQGNKSVYAAISKRKSLTFAPLAVTNKPNKSESQMVTERTGMKRLISLFTNDINDTSCRNDGYSRMYLQNLMQ